MNRSELEVPSAWREIDLNALQGVILIIGATDTGKSTLAHYLYSELAERGTKVAFLDGDPGQSQLGPPTTINLALAKPDDPAFPPEGASWQRFVGSTSPSGHMLPLVAGAARLAAAGRQAGATTLVYDTTGLIDPAAGGHYLKWTKIELLQVTTVLALQNDYELEHMIQPLRHREQLRVLEFSPPKSVRGRGRDERRRYRSARYKAYFKAARERTLDWGDLAVYPNPEFNKGRLLSLENADGFCLGLGVVLSAEPEAKRITLHTPVDSFSPVDGLRLGDVALDLQSYQDQLLY